MTAGEVARSAGRTPGGTLVRVRVLGGFDVAVAGRSLTRADWQRVSAERLFKLLLVTPGHAVSREMAAETLWPEAEPELSRANLRKAIHFAHHALQPIDILGGDSRWIRLDTDSLDLDLDRLQRAFDEHGRADGRTVDGAIDTILELGRRTLLPDDPYEDWLAVPRERLASRWEDVALVTAREARAAGRIAQAYEIVDRLLDHDPTDEAAHRLAIELYAAEGRHHAVRRQFALCRRALLDGLDTEPSPETVEAFRSAERAASDLPHAPAAPRLVARRAELERIEPILDRVAAGHIGALVIRGPAGIGKTRLLAELAAYARPAGWQVVEWQSVESTRDVAYAPLRIGLGRIIERERLAAIEEPGRSGLATILPGFGVTPAITFADRAALVAALAAGIERLSRERPLCLVLDDLPWLDPSTLEALATTMAGSDASVLVATTLRDDEPIPDEARAFVDQVRHAGGVELSLGPLALRDVESLIVAHMGGQAVQPELARFAFDQSDGNPLFCLELIRAGQEDGALRLDGDRWVVVDRGSLPSLPDSVRRLVAQRARNLQPGAQELVATAAELGPEVDFDALSRSLPDVAGGLIPALDAALASGLMVERGRGYAFAHPLYRLAVGGAMGLARRGTVQLRIAWALAGPRVAPGASPEELEAAAAAVPDATTIAEHALMAWEHGAIDAQLLAVAYAFAAGNRERRLFNRAVARGLLERAVAAWRRLPAESRARFNATRALIDLGELLVADGDDAGAEALLREAAENARTARRLADAYHALWELPYRHGDFEAAMAVIREGLGRLPEDALVERANLRRDLGWQLVRLRQPSAALAPTKEAAEILVHSADLAGAARAVDQQAMVLSYLGRRERWVELEERALALAMESGDYDAELIARLHLGTALTRTGSATRARPVLDKARELARLMGHAYGQALAAWAAAEVEDALGDYEAAAEHRRGELRLLGSFGGNPHNEAMAHAHLSRLSRLLGDLDAARTEADAARELARRSGEVGYLERIDRALTIERWLDMET